MGTIKSSAMYAAPYLLFVSGRPFGPLMAQRFDLESGQLSGEPIQLTERTSQFSDRGTFSVSQTGKLAFATGDGRSGGGNQLSWLNRDGKTIGTVGEAASYGNLNLSPDERQLVASSRGALWIVDLAHAGNRTIFEPEKDSDYNPVWSPPDAKLIAFNSNRGGLWALFVRPADGSGRDVLLTDRQGMTPDWSPDGKFLIFTINNDIWVQAATPGSQPSAFLETASHEDSPAFSPDGRFVVYSSDKTNRAEIYVRPFPSKDPESKISINGGLHPRWRKQDEITFLSLGGMMMSAKLRFERGNVKAVIEERFPTELQGTPNRHPYAVTRDGQRFIMAVPRVSPSTIPIIVWTNWTARLPK